MTSAGLHMPVPTQVDRATAASSDATLPVGDALDLLPDPSPRLAESFRAVATRMDGLAFINPSLCVEAIGFAPWQGHWLGVLLTPWFMNLILAPRDAASWPSLKPGDKRCYHFPAGAFDFIGARDELAGEYQMCSLFSPLLQFDDQETARRVAELAREALFDGANAEKPDLPSGNLSPPPASASTNPGPLEKLEAQLEVPQSKRDFLRGRWSGDDRGTRG
jgi:[NiFe] hydrogenase assembly HybE family chaperone